MLVPDPIEQGERRIERWADVSVWGDSFRCDCGRMCELHNGIALSPNPNCIPVCPECAMQNPAYRAWVESPLRRSARPAR